MKRFDLKSTPLEGVRVLTRRPVEDVRGHLCRLYCSDDFREMGISMPILQINHTLTLARGTVRGMHFQHAPYGEIKVVSCLKGEIFDVALDIRRGSPTFMQWHAEILSEDNFRSLLIPGGVAHGFQALTDNCELVYLHSEAYHPEAEGALNAADPSYSIQWPLEITQMSERDRAHPFLSADFKGITP